MTKNLKIAIFLLVTTGSNIALTDQLTPRQQYVNRACGTNCKANETCCVAPNDTGYTYCVPKGQKCGHPLNQEIL